MPPSSDAPSFAALNFVSSDSATNIDAAPPIPLKKATSSGIAVIGTRVARRAPTLAPTSAPARMIQSEVWPRSRRSHIVAPNASNIPPAASWLPLRAVLTPDRRLRPTTNSIAAAM